MPQPDRNSRWAPTETDELAGRRGATSRCRATVPAPPGTPTPSGKLCASPKELDSRSHVAATSSRSAQATWSARQAANGTGTAPHLTTSCRTSPSLRASLRVRGPRRNGGRTSLRASTAARCSRWRRCCRKDGACRSPGWCLAGQLVDVPVEGAGVTPMRFADLDDGEGASVRLPADQKVGGPLVETEAGNCMPLDIGPRLLSPRLLTRSTIGVSPSLTELVAVDGREHTGPQSEALVTPVGKGLPELASGCGPRSGTVLRQPRRPLREI